MSALDTTSPLRRRLVSLSSPSLVSIQISSRRSPKASLDPSFRCSGFLAKVNLFESYLLNLPDAERCPLGLSETEITEVLGINSSTWSPLFIAMTEMVVSKSGSLTFFHDYMRQAVEQRYLKPRNEYNAYRDKLVAHFSAPGRDQQRRLEEVLHSSLMSFDDF